MKVFKKFLSMPQKARKLLLEAQDVNLIRTSGFFDKDWYLSNNPDVARAKIDPVRHYLRHGGFEGRDPSPKFYSGSYLDTYSDVKRTRINPLIHYLKYGKLEGRVPRPSFGRGVVNPPGMGTMRCDPIIVHQMGKVGSRTVVSSLAKIFSDLGIEIPVFHTHALNDFATGRQLVVQQQNLRNPQSRLETLEDGEHVRKLIDENPTQHWNIITLVRDPVARNVAAFFHDLAEYIPDWRKRYSAGALNAHDVQEVFLKLTPLFAFDHLDSWFDVQIKAIPAFGIDVYANPFPYETGYKIYPGSAQANLLLIRLENLTECAESAMQEFLGIENFSLHNTNVGEEKDYANLYHAFKKLPLNPNYVEKAYKTQFARHFYSETELDMFTTKWTAKAPNRST